MISERQYKYIFFGWWAEGERGEALRNLKTNYSTSVQVNILKINQN